MKKIHFNKSLLRYVIIIILILIFTEVVVLVNSTIPRKVEIDKKYKWDLTDLYNSREEFEADINKLKLELIPKLNSYKGKLNNPQIVYEYFELDSEVLKVLMKSFRYAKLSLDLNQTDNNAQEMVYIANRVYGQYSEATSFVRPQLIALKEDKIYELINDPILSQYKSYLEKIIKEKEHTLSEKEEKLLSMISDFSGIPNDIFDMVMYADYEYPIIKDSKGNNIKLTNKEYNKILQEENEEIRKKAFESRADSYRKINNTLSATYIGEIKKNIFYAKARGYNSAIEYSLSREYIKREIYDGLINSVNNNLKYLHKYNEIKKKFYGLDKMHAYDTSLPIVKNYNMEITYDEAVDLITKGLKPLGKKYIDDFLEGINSNWVDVYEDENKYTGAYSASSYGEHPFILMNFKNDLDSALVLAHEMGHSLNTKYSNENQNLYNSNYPIFTAEVASTANEMLVMDYLIKNAKNDKEKLFLINKQIENIKGTVYTQVMFSEFEKKAHEIVELGEPLSSEILNNLWINLIKKYNGDAYTVDDMSKYGWERVPHFYMNFYVYKYASAIAASYKITNEIIENKEGAVDRYLEFLSAGGSDYPIEVLKKAGVDMTTSKAIDEILDYFGRLVNEMEMLLF